MDVIFGTFRAAQQQGKGYELAQTLMPMAPPEYPDMLRAFYRSTNAANVESDIRYSILYEKSPKLNISNQEGNAWVDVYAKYWRAVGEILKAEDASPSEKQVRKFLIS